MPLNSRAIAASALATIVGNGISLDAALAEKLQTIDDQRDRAFVQELVYGVLRWYWRLLPQMQALVRRPLRERDRDIEMLLLIGLYQLQYLATPVHAAVSATVDGCAALRKPWARGLVNGALRNAARHPDLYAKTADAAPALATAHPDWIVRTIRQDWPAHWAAILDANNAHPPFTLRVNTGRMSRAAYLHLLAAAGLEASATTYAPEGIRLESAVPVDALPEFSSGAVSVQDEAAQLAVSVLQVPPRARVLDACAAPGGKSAHILEKQSEGVALVALDRSESRIERLRDSLRRLGLSATVVVADAADTGAWWDGVAFDRILIDAPCSGSGVIRRHPDIKLHRQPRDIEHMTETQSRLLAALWPLLAPGGKLVYSTCSIFKAENDQVVARFVSATDDAEIDPIEAEWGVASNYGRQIITGDEQMDGFYYARLRRSGAAVTVPATVAAD